MEAADCIVIGAGPAGLFCAIHAAAPECRVIILEKNARPGAKLLLAGSGQCNITHDGEIRDFLTHYGNHGRFLRTALMSFSNKDLVEFFYERGLGMETEKNGKIFPSTRKSDDVLEILRDECTKRGVSIRYSEPVQDLIRAGDGFRITTENGEYQARTIVLATGGASYQKTGSTGDGYRLAGALDQPVTERAPALTPVIIREYPFADLAGISFENLPFTVWRSGRKAGTWRGDILFTHTGLSGPGILDASRDIRAGDVIRISFAGDLTRETFAGELTGLVQANGPRLVRTIMAGFPVPDRLLKKILLLSGIPDDLTCAHLTAKQRSLLIACCTEFPLTVDRLGDFSIAMATRGGVALDDVNQKTMESKCVPGLFFAGEVLDIDGDTGGYNLQAAFSTGYCAAMGIRAACNQPPNRSA
ncbi:MAG: NAD(P)/FAD-dependent oxidoreductase [Methanoregula sp.]|nr:NAD(P)/FAD-dependent oxidoreductase [Methanoregula sp.]MDD1686058.1 NAD(P)/FAD-dependent oxidoreductase [Methanoregula sp.]